MKEIQVRLDMIVLLYNRMVLALDTITGLCQQFQDAVNDDDRKIITIRLSSELEALRELTMQIQEEVEGF